MSTLVKIKTAIDRLASHERDALAALLWQDEETPPAVPEKLAEALASRFVPSDRANIERIIAAVVSAPEKS